MQYCEVLNARSYLMAVQSTIEENQAMMNNAENKDSKKFIENYNNNVLVPEIQQLEELLNVNGGSLPTQHSK